MPEFKDLNQRIYEGQNTPTSKKRDRFIQRLGEKFAVASQKAREKFDWYTDPIQLAGKFILAQEAHDLPQMRTPLPESEWRDFFLKQAKSLEAVSFS